VPIAEVHLGRQHSLAPATSVVTCVNFDSVVPWNRWPVERIEAFRNAQSETMTLGFSATAPIFATLFAQCLEKKGHAEGALAALEAAVVQIDGTGYNVWEPELYRSMG
jgi:hypothetical protein